MQEQEVETEEPVPICENTTKICKKRTELIHNENKKVNVAEEEEEIWRNIDVFIAELEPEELIVIEVKIGEEAVQAMIDTGSSHSLISQSLVTDNEGNHNGEAISLKGLGSNILVTQGSKDIQLEYFSFKTTTTFHIVPSKSMKFPIILGRDFCQNERLELWLKKNMISKHFDGKARTDIYLDKRDGIMTAKTMINENFTLYAIETIKIKPGLNKIKVKSSIPEQCGYDNKLLYDGKCKNSKLIGLEGIIEANQPIIEVLVKTKDISKHTPTIKVNEPVGYICSVVETEDLTDQIEQDFDNIKDRLNTGKLSANQEEQVKLILKRTLSVIGKDDYDIGRAKVSPHQIELTDYTPIWQKPRRVPEPVKQEIEEQCRQLELMDIIEKCDSDWSSPVVPVKKKDGKLRLCVDYRRLNKVTVEQNFPIPNLTDSIYSANKIKYFTKLDLIKGYYQVPIHPDSRKFTAFSTIDNQYQFKRLSFGLKNAGIQFQKNIDEILTDFKTKKVIAYIDDILIMSETFDEHLILVEKVLTTLMTNGVKIKIDKCEFFKDEISFLGHVISKDGIKKSPEFTDKVRNYPKPTNVTELRRFMGLCNFQRKFVDKYAEISKPLTKLTGGPKRKTLEWTEEMEISFKLLTTKLAEEVNLAFPDYSADANKLELYVDASSIGAGACLMQLQEGEYRPIAYNSMAFNPTQQRYSTIERELLALRWGVKTFRAFLFGVDFIIHTDHKPLLYLRNMSRDNARLMRTLNELEDFNYVIQYKPGSENLAADAMSRIIHWSREPAENREVSDCNPPTGFRVMEKIDGGGDSMFIALQKVLEDHDLQTELPTDHGEMRKVLVTHLLSNTKKFNVRCDKERRKWIEVMMFKGVLPCEEILLAAADLYSVEIWIHCGMKTPVVYKAKQSTDIIVHMQCLAGTHYNPLTKFKKSLEINILDKNINAQFTDEPTEIEQINPTELETNQVNISQPVITEHFSSCNHHWKEFGKCIVKMNEEQFCAVFDTGAQICVISDSVVRKIRNENLKIQKVDSVRLTGLGEQTTVVNEIVLIKPTILGIQVDKEMPFAVVQEDKIPYCMILGLNFIKNNNIGVDFYSQSIYLTTEQEEEAAYSCTEQTQNNRAELLINMMEAESQEEVEEGEQEDDENVEDDFNVKFTINDNNFKRIQANNNALINLSRKIKNMTPATAWKERYLKQYKRYAGELEIKDGILIRKYKNNFPVVIPFNLMIEIVWKSHTEMGHIGRYKLFNILSDKFWHPSLDKLTRDVCNSCYHCQIYKVSRQSVKPPMMKISPSKPFEIVAVDLMQLPPTPRGNIGIMVAVDHYSKWLAAVPFKDKKGSTTARILRENILQNLPCIPEKILSDNGREFKCEDFNNVLNKYNINHIYSTPYKPSSNGCVERHNRTLIQLLKGNLGHGDKNWDLNLPEAIIINNTTAHSEIGQSPSDKIMNYSYDKNRTIPIAQDIQKTWDEGNPKFSPYKIGTKVLRKRIRIGNQVSDKLKPRYDGLYSVVKVQPNNVTYVIQKINSDDKINVHYNQIKKFVEMPNYLKKVILQDPIDLQLTVTTDSDRDISDDDVTSEGGENLIGRHGEMNITTSSDSDDARLAVHNQTNEIVELSAARANNQVIASALLGTIKSTQNQVTNAFPYNPTTAIRPSGLDALLDDSMTRLPDFRGFDHFVDSPDESEMTNQISNQNNLRIPVMRKLSVVLKRLEDERNLEGLIQQNIDDRTQISRIKPRYNLRSRAKSRLRRLSTESNSSDSDFSETEKLDPSAARKLKRRTRTPKTLELTEINNSESNSSFELGDSNLSNDIFSTRRKSTSMYCTPAFNVETENGHHSIAAINTDKFPCQLGVVGFESIINKIVANENNRNRITSTPKQMCQPDVDISLGSMPQNTNTKITDDQISHHKTNLSENEGDLTKSNVKLDTLLTLLERAWTFNERIIQETIEDVEIESNDKSSDIGIVENSQPIQTEDLKSFTGFETKPDHINIGSVKLNRLKLLKRRSAEFKNMILSFREDTNNFLSSVWSRDKTECYSAPTPNPILNFSDNESMDSTLQHRYVFMSPRRTRSKGGVLDLPNVQPRTLEYNKFPI